MERQDLVEEKEEKRKKREKTRIPFTPLSPANLLRNKLTSVSAKSPHSISCCVCSLKIVTFFSL